MMVISMTNKKDLLKIIGIKAIPFLMGLGLSTIGKRTGCEWLPWVPPLIDLYGGSINHPKDIIKYVEYGIGGGLPYYHEIYKIFKEFISKNSS